LPISTSLSQRSKLALATMSLCLLTIPLEIRIVIYRYLLLDQNVAYDTRGSNKTLRAKFETSLFRVCKIISAESLGFFYSQNAFVVVDSNMHTLLPLCQKAMPIFLGAKTSSFKHYILGITLRMVIKSDDEHRDGILDTKQLSILEEQANAVSVGGERCIRDWGDLQSQDVFPPRTTWSAGIIAARHLQKFVNLMNSSLSCCSPHEVEDDWDNSELTLRFCTTGPYFRNNRKILNTVVQGLSGIRASTIPRPDGLRLTHWGNGPQEIMATPYESTVILNIFGDLKEEQQEEIKRATYPKFPKVSELAALSTTIMEKGDALMRVKDYTEARGEYAVAYFLSSKLLPNKHLEILKEDGDLIQKLLSLAVEIRLATSMVNSQQGYHKSAIFMAENAWLLVNGRRALTSTPETKARIQFRLGLALAGDGQYGEAVLAMISAVRLSPSNTEMMNKLVEIKALHQRSRSHEKRRRRS
jgi:hypothetical protein